MFLSKFTSNRIFCARNFAVISYRYLKGVGNLCSSKPLFFHKKKNFKMKRTILMLWVAVALASCSKSKMENTIAQGRILAYGSNQPVAGARVSLQGCTYSWQGGGYCNIIDSTTTQSDGKYHFNFVGESTDNYIVFVKADGYHKNDYLINDFHTDFTHDITLDPYSWIRLHVKNIRPFDSQDNIRYGVTSGGTGGSAIDNVGKNIDLYDVQQLIGAKSHNLLWLVVKNNIQTIFRDTIYIAAHDTINYEILY